MSSPQLQKGDVHRRKGYSESDVDPESSRLQAKAEGADAGQGHAQSKLRFTRNQILVRFIAVFVLIFAFVDYALVNPITLIRTLIRDALDTSDEYINHTRLVFPSDVKVKDCVDWSIKKGWYKTVATTSLDLPLDSDKLFFLREGWVIGGTFDVVQSDSISDKVHVEVVFTAPKAEFVEDTKVCFLGHETGGDGVGILADFAAHLDRSNTNFGITVTLPRSAGGQLALKTFESNLTHIQQVLSLNDNINFERLSIVSEYASIVADNIIANQVDLKTTHTPISGSVNASESLSLSTRNSNISGQFTSPSISVQNSYAPIFGRYTSSGSITLVNSHDVIDAQFDLLHDGVTMNKTVLDLETTFAFIKGTITSTSLAPNGLGGSFSISSKTNNAFNSLSVPSISPRAHLDISASTTLAPISISLSSAWEGEYLVDVGHFSRDSPATADITVRNGGDKDQGGVDGVVDPEGKGRERKAYHLVDVDTPASDPGTDGIYCGRVWWGTPKNEDDRKEGGKGKGSVKMSTSFSWARLVL